MKTAQPKVGQLLKERDALTLQLSDTDRALRQSQTIANEALRELGVVKEERDNRYKQAKDASDAALRIAKERDELKGRLVFVEKEVDELSDKYDRKVIAYADLSDEVSVLEALNDVLKTGYTDGGRK